MTKTEAYDSLGSTREAVLDNLICMGVTGDSKTTNNVFLQYLRLLKYDVEMYCATRGGLSWAIELIADRSHGRNRLVRCGDAIIRAHTCYVMKLRQTPNAIYGNRT